MIDYTKRGQKDASEIYQELKRISNRDDGIKPRVVVDEARPPDSVLHPEFEWDDRVAGEEYRVVQARNLIRAVHIIDSGEDRGSAFVHVSREGDSDEGVGASLVYLPVQEVVARKDYFESAVEELAAKLAQISKALEDLKRMASQQFKTGRKRKLSKTLQHVENARNTLEQL
jgi:hypothetical protein